ncbi:MAG: hypothetical protein AAF830_00710 [Pseudomonadota bacterium]
MIVLALAAIGLSHSAAAADGQRTVKGPEPGKCIFSTEVMPKGDFRNSAYRKVKDTFALGDPIAVRCFYEMGQQSNYASLGRVANSMRDSGKYYAEYEWTKPDGSPGSHSDFRIVAYNHNFRADWDQQRYDLTDDHAACDFQIKGRKQQEFGAKSSGCMDFAKFTQIQSKKMRVKAPETPEFCIRVFMKFANTRSLRTVGNDLREEPDYVEKTMARGCFKVDLTS